MIAPQPTTSLADVSLKRVFPIDVFRALTMVTMIFVNDLWTLSGVPAWLEQVKADQDFPGFSDTVFPCFLFIVGMSIPFAIRQRLDKGYTSVLLDEVRYQKKGESNMLIGFDYPFKTDSLAFVWRGKSVLSLVRSKWKVSRAASPK